MTCDGPPQVEMAATIGEIPDHPTATVVITVHADTVEAAQTLMLRTLGADRRAGLDGEGGT